MPRIFALFLVSLPLWLAAQYPLQSVLQQLIEDPQLVGTKWSVCAVDLTTGDTIAAYLPAQQLPGASITKMVSTAAALTVLGPDYQAQTKLYLDGQMKPNGVFDGNVWIVGGGDVSLGSRYFAAPGLELGFLTDWVAHIQKQGIQYITGQIIADASAYGCRLGAGRYGQLLRLRLIWPQFLRQHAQINFSNRSLRNPDCLKELFSE